MNYNVWHTTVQQRIHLDYEYQLIKLKRDAHILQLKIQQKASQSLIKKLSTDFQYQVTCLRKLFSHYPELAQHASSFFVVPTRELKRDERIIHRIWLGGLPPDQVSQTTDQWFCAIEFARQQGAACFSQHLWVWDAAQLLADKRFVAEEGGDPLHLGYIITPEGTQQIKGLQALLETQNGAAKKFVIQLHEKGYYATLSDYFRLLILMHCGGIYMDADTLPFKPVSWFLFKPELPYFMHVPESESALVTLSCLNLFLDETGLIIATKGDPTLREMFIRLNEAWLGLPLDVPDKNAAWERQVFGLFYAIWQEYLSRMLISHDEFCRQYAVYYRGAKEAVPGGATGMRLLEDIITNEKRPLSEVEEKSYQSAINALGAINWRLEDPLELPGYLDIYDLTEHPRIAYALQLRSNIEHFHYYAVLSRDENLDRVNKLFADYLLQRNQQAVNGGNFWQPILQSSESKLFQEKKSLLPSGTLIFGDGKESTTQERHRMAKLIFSTSYLEYCSVGNPSGSDIVSLQRAQNIEPMLAFITVVYTAAAEFAGFFIAGIMKELMKQPLPWLYRDEIRPVDRNYEEFVARYSHENDYFISSLALEALHRGKGYLHPLLSEIQGRARRLKAKRITLCAWEKSEASEIWLNQGFRQIAILESCQPLFGDRVIFMQRSVGVN